MGGIAVLLLFLSLSANAGEKIPDDNPDVSSLYAPGGKKTITRSVTLDNVVFELSAQDDGAVSLARIPLGDKQWILEATVRHAGASQSPAVTLKLKMPLNGIAGLQHYSGSFAKDITSRGSIPYWKYDFITGPTLGDPYMSLVGNDNKNIIFIGAQDIFGKYQCVQEMSDPLRSMLITVSGPLDEKSKNQSSVVRFFVSFDRRDVFDVYADYKDFVDREYKYIKMPVPEWAYDPIYCTWSAARSYVDSKWLMRTAPLARELGFKSIILDDGWFDFNEKTAGWDKAERSMIYIGKWENHPRKFPDLAGDIKKIQAQGLRLILWCAPFRVGAHGPLWETYKQLGWHRTINDTRAASVYVDPRYPEVREFVSRIFSKLIDDYNVDGLKIDMVDSVGMRMEPHMDTSIDGIKTGPIYADMMDGIMKDLRRKKPELVVESRIGYANLAARNWTNAYRVFDCPYNIDMNRLSAAVLRRMYPDRAVYMDPIIWPPDESDANVGRIMINAIFAVPQISLDLETLPETHRSIIKHWIKFYTNHRSTIMQGRFTPRFSGAMVPEAVFETDNETIVGLYENQPLKLENIRKVIYVLNASTRDFVDLIGLPQSGSASIVDRYGKPCGTQELSQSCRRLAVPVGGYAKITAIQLSK